MRGSLKTRTHCLCLFLSMTCQGFCLDMGGDVLMLRSEMILSFKFIWSYTECLLQKTADIYSTYQHPGEKEMVLSKIELLSLSLCFCCTGWKLCCKGGREIRQRKDGLWWETLPWITTSSCYFWHIAVLWTKQVHGHIWLLGIVLFFRVHNLRFSR